MKCSTTSPRDLSFALRIALWGGALLLTIGYAVLIPMKCYGMLPPEMTWARIVVGPALMVGMAPAFILAAMRFPKRTRFWLCMVSVVLGVIALLVILLDSGCHPVHP